MKNYEKILLKIKDDKHDRQVKIVEDFAEKLSNVYSDRENRILSYLKYRHYKKCLEYHLIKLSKMKQLENESGGWIINGIKNVVYKKEDLD